LHIEADIKPSQDYVLSFDVDTAGNEYYLNEKLLVYKNFTVSKGKNYIQCKVIDSISKSNHLQYNDVPELKGWILLKNSKTQENDIQFSNVQLERGSTVSDYAPYASQSQSFILPPEHPYLAKLPDGTADKIIVDKDGNAKLVAVTTKVMPKDGNIDWNAATATSHANAAFGVPAAKDLSHFLCNSYITSDRSIDKSGYAYFPLQSGIRIIDDRFTSKEVAVELLKDTVFYYAANEEVTYDLGKINLPAIPEQVSNIWTDAEVIPNTTIDYVRDVSVVVKKLEQAIASIV
jgi:hypothetical protein